MLSWGIICRSRPVKPQKAFLIKACDQEGLVTVSFPASRDGNQKNEKRVSLIVCSEERWRVRAERPKVSVPVMAVCQGCEANKGDIVV